MNKLVCQGCRDSVDITPTNNFGEAMKESGMFPYLTGTPGQTIWMCETCDERVKTALQRVADIFGTKARDVVITQLPGAESHIPKHTPVAVDSADITDADRALVRDFWDNACHADWCEFDDLQLLYMVVRSRLDGAKEERMKWQGEIP